MNYEDQKKKGQRRNLNQESTKGNKFTSQLHTDNRQETQSQADLIASIQRQALANQPSYTNKSKSVVQQKENKTGLPDNLKSGIENLSGYSMDDVNVHYNSNKPKQLQAHAFAQGTDIHVASGQEKHLPHEAWHVAQQKQGRVKPTLQMKGNVPVNDDAGLEKEADVMGAKAVQLKQTDKNVTEQSVQTPTIQRAPDESIRKVTDDRMNDLVDNVSDMLKRLMKKSKDWEQELSKKGKELGEGQVDKLTTKKKKGPSKKDQIMKIVVKRSLKLWWNNLSLEEKADAVGKTTSGVGQVMSSIVSGITGFFGRGGDDEEAEKEPATKEEIEADFTALINQDSLEAMYEVARGYRKINAEIEKVKAKVKEGAGEAGGTVGAFVGDMINSQNFTSKWKKEEKLFNVARLRYEMLKESIKNNDDTERYVLEQESIEDVLHARLQGPYHIINHPERFADKESINNVIEICSIARHNLKGAQSERQGIVYSVLGDTGRTLGRLVERGTDMLGITHSDEDRAPLQGNLLTNIKAVCNNKKWSSFTYGLFKDKPNGVKDALAAIDSSKTDKENLEAIKTVFTKPEDDLKITDDAIKVEMKKLNDIRKDIMTLKERLGIVNVVDETTKEVSEINSQERLYKGVEKFTKKAELLGKEAEEKSSAAQLPLLYKQQKDLEKKIAGGSNRKPLTQMFYSAIKNIDVDDKVSLNKAMAVMADIQQELNTKKFKKQLT